MARYALKRKRPAAYLQPAAGGLIRDWRDIGCRVEARCTEPMPSPGAFMCAIPGDRLVGTYRASESALHLGGSHEDQTPRFLTLAFLQACGRRRDNGDVQALR